MSTRSAVDPLTLATHLGVLKYLSDWLNATRKEELGPQAVKEFPVGSRVPVMIAGQHAGFLTIPQPRKTATVTSEAQFLAWVKKNHPTEVVTIPQVRPSFAELVLKSVKDRGGWVDKKTGELVQVPGVTSGEGDAYPMVKLSDGAEAIIAAAWLAGKLDLGEMLALPASESPKAAA